MLIVIAMFVLHLAVPKLTAALKPSGAQILWITDIYPFLIAGLLVPMGVLGDRIGRRGAAAFGAASARRPPPGVADARGGRQPPRAADSRDGRGRGKCPAASPTGTTSGR